jgi:hypothetical protein
MPSKRELQRQISNLGHELKFVKGQIEDLHGQIYERYKFRTNNPFSIFPDVISPTLKAKVEAILEHLGLDISVKDSERRLTIKSKFLEPAKKGKK